MSKITNNSGYITKRELITKDFKRNKTLLASTDYFCTA